MRKALELALEALEDRTSLMKWQIARDAVKEALAQPEQEPVAYIHRNEYSEYRLEPHDNFDIKSIPFNVDVPLFKAPQRQPLTDEDIDNAINALFDCEEKTWRVRMRAAIEAAHGIKEKNT